MNMEMLKRFKTYTKQTLKSRMTTPTTNLNSRGTVDCGGTGGTIVSTVGI
jgi:hypothetical protein